MEKRNPHYSLTRAQSLIGDGKVRATRSALEGAALLGLGFEGMLEVVLSLRRQDFYKSMTTYRDHRVWQDVYHATTNADDVYLKLTILEDVLIVSFKPL